MRQRKIYQILKKIFIVSLSVEMAGCGIMAEYNPNHLRHPILLPGSRRSVHPQPAAPERTLPPNEEPAFKPTPLSPAERRHLKRIERKVEKRVNERIEKELQPQTTTHKKRHHHAHKKSQLSPQELAALRQALRAQIKEQIHHEVVSEFQREKWRSAVIQEQVQREDAEQDGWGAQGKKPPRQYTWEAVEPRRKRLGTVEKPEQRVAEKSKLLEAQRPISSLQPTAEKNKHLTPSIITSEKPLPQKPSQAIKSTFSAQKNMTENHRKTVEKEQTFITSQKETISSKPNHLKQPESLLLQKRESEQKNLEIISSKAHENESKSLPIAHRAAKTATLEKLSTANESKSLPIAKAEPAQRNVEHVTNEVAHEKISSSKELSSLPLAKAKSKEGMVEQAGLQSYETSNASKEIEVLPTPIRKSEQKNSELIKNQAPESTTLTKGVAKPTTSPLPVKIIQPETKITQAAPATSEIPLMMQAAEVARLPLRLKSEILSTKGHPPTYIPAGPIAPPPTELAIAGITLNLPYKQAWSYLDRNLNLLGYQSIDKHKKMGTYYLLDLNSKNKLDLGTQAYEIHLESAQNKTNVTFYALKPLHYDLNAALNILHVLQIKPYSAWPSLNKTWNKLGQYAFSIAPSSNYDTYLSQINNEIEAEDKAAIAAAAALAAQQQRQAQAAMATKAAALAQAQVAAKAKQSELQSLVQAEKVRMVEQQQAQAAAKTAAVEQQKLTTIRAAEAHLQQQAQAAAQVKLEAQMQTAAALKAQQASQAQIQTAEAERKAAAQQAKAAETAALIADQEREAAFAVLAAAEQQAKNVAAAKAEAQKMADTAAAAKLKAEQIAKSAALAKKEAQTNAASTSNVKAAASQEKQAASQANIEAQSETEVAVEANVEAQNQAKVAAKAAEQADKAAKVAAALKAKNEIEARIKKAAADRAAAEAKIATAQKLKAKNEAKAAAALRALTQSQAKATRAAQIESQNKAQADIKLDQAAQEQLKVQAVTSTSQTQSIQLEKINQQTEQLKAKAAAEADLERQAQAIAAVQATLAAQDQARAAAAAKIVQQRAAEAKAIDAAKKLEEQTKQIAELQAQMAAKAKAEQAKIKPVNKLNLPKPQSQLKSLPAPTETKHTQLAEVASSLKKEGKTTEVRIGRMTIHQFKPESGSPIPGNKIEPISTSQPQRPSVKPGTGQVQKAAESFNNAKIAPKQPVMNMRANVSQNTTHSPNQSQPSVPAKIVAKGATPAPGPTPVAMTAKSQTNPAGQMSAQLGQPVSKSLQPETTKKMVAAKNQVQEKAAIATANSATSQPNLMIFKAEKQKQIPQPHMIEAAAPKSMHSSESAMVEAQSAALNKSNLATIQMPRPTLTLKNKSTARPKIESAKPDQEKKSIPQPIALKANPQSLPKIVATPLIFKKNESHPLNLVQKNILPENKKTGIENTHLAKANKLQMPQPHPSEALHSAPTLLMLKREPEKKLPQPLPPLAQAPLQMAPVPVPVLGPKNEPKVVERPIAAIEKSMPLAESPAINSFIPRPVARIKTATNLNPEQEKLIKRASPVVVIQHPLLINADYDKTWALVGDALKNNPQGKIILNDKKTGLYIISDLRKKERMQKASIYQIKLINKGKKTVLTILDENSKKSDNSSAQSILLSVLKQARQQAIQNGTAPVVAITAEIPATDSSAHYYSLMPTSTLNALVPVKENSDKGVNAMIAPPKNNTLLMAATNQVLAVKISYDLAWQRVNQAFQQTTYKILQKNRESGMYQVAANNPGNSKDQYTIYLRPVSNGLINIMIYRNGVATGSTDQNIINILKQAFENKLE